MSTKTVYLSTSPRILSFIFPSLTVCDVVSGANRGIGLGLATTIAKRPNTIVFAGARDPSAQALKDLSAKYPNVYPVKLNSGNKEDNEAAAKYIEEKAGQLDVIIANAGKYSFFAVDCNINNYYYWDRYLQVLRPPRYNPHLRIRRPLESKRHGPRRPIPSHPQTPPRLTHQSPHVRRYLHRSSIHQRLHPHGFFCLWVFQDGC